ALHRVRALVGDPAHADDVAVLARLRPRIDARAPRDEVGYELLDAPDPLVLAHRPGVAGAFLAGGWLDRPHLRQQAAMRGHTVETDLACRHADGRHRLRLAPNRGEIREQLRMRRPLR